VVWVYGGFVNDYYQIYYEHYDVVWWVVDRDWRCGALGSMWREWVDRADCLRERVYLHCCQCVVFPVFVVVYYILVLISMSS
jgi:hypothetical protein